MYQNSLLILKFHLLIPGPTNKISTENWQSKSVYCENWFVQKAQAFELGSKRKDMERNHLCPILKMNLADLRMQ